MKNKFHRAGMVRDFVREFNNGLATSIIVERSIGIVERFPQCAREPSRFSDMMFKIAEMVESLRTVKTARQFRLIFKGFVLVCFRRVGHASAFK
jgi:hypothetical protein